MKVTLKLTAAFSCFAFSQMAFASILPPNDLHLRDNPSILANMTEDEFNTIINEIVDYYRPIVEAKGATLKTNNLWTNTTVNASAQQNGNTWIINMYGGLARRPEVTPDGFAMVVCHELGHHLAGFPFYGNDDWASSEGQSDYFATQSCARQIWRTQRAENARFADQVTEAEKQKCESAWRSDDDRNLCYRTVAAGNSLATLLSALNNGGVPKSDTPDLNQVRQTQTAHPKAQCRLDTYFAGSLCGVEFDETVIPARRHPKGQTSIEAEQTASTSSCMASTGWNVGNRPRCWYAPRMDFQALRFGFTEVKDLGNGNGAVEPGEAAHVNFSLSNGTQSASSGVTGTLTSATPGVTVTKGSASWPDIAPGEGAMAQEPFAVNLASSVTCGSNFALDLAAASSQGSTTITKSFLVGKLIENVAGANSTRIDIPDNNRTGVISTIANATGGNATAAKVEVAIAHPFPTDLLVSLVSPQGKSTQIYPAAGSNGLSALKAPKALRKALGKGLAQGIYQTFDVALGAVEAQGEWSVKVIDKAPRDVGTLENWGLTLTRAECEGRALAGK